MLNSKKICVILPALNESATIQRVIEAMPSIVDKVIVVDDGSKDGTGDIAARCGATVCRHEVNRGLGMAFRTGLDKALELGGDVIVNIDADGQFDPADITKVVAPIVDGSAGFVTASRFKDPSLYPSMTKLKFYGNHGMSWLISRIIGKRFYDVSCGFRAYSRETALRINLFGRYTYTQESFIDLAVKEVTMVEVPLRVRGIREFGKSRVASNLIKYTYNSLKIIIRIVRDYRAMKFFGWLSLIPFLLSLATGALFLINFWMTGHFYPHRWAGFASAFFAFSAAGLFALGFVLDMGSRVRRVQEETLYQLRRLRFDKETRN